MKYKVVNFYRKHSVMPASDIPLRELFRHLTMLHYKIGTEFWVKSFISFRAKVIK